VEVQLHAFLTSALDGDELSASRAGLFTAPERTHSTHWTGRWVGPGASMDAVVRTKIPEHKMRKKGNVHKTLTRKPEGKRTIWKT